MHHYLEKIFINIPEYIGPPTTVYIGYRVAGSPEEAIERTRDISYNAHGHGTQLLNAYIFFTRGLELGSLPRLSTKTARGFDRLCVPGLWPDERRIIDRHGLC